MPKVPLHVRMTPDLIRRIDEARGEQSRASWIADACAWRLIYERERRLRAARHAARNR